MLAVRRPTLTVVAGHQGGYQAGDQAGGWRRLDQVGRQDGDRGHPGATILVVHDVHRPEDLPAHPDVDGIAERLPLEGEPGAVQHAAQRPLHALDLRLG